MAFVNYNAWAEVVCTPVDFVYKMPDEMTFAEAAAFSLNFVAAYMMLFEVANLREGMSVLVHSAGGGVVSAFLHFLSGTATELVHPSLTDGFIPTNGCSNVVCLLLLTVVYGNITQYRF